MAEWNPLLGIIPSMLINQQPVESKQPFDIKEFKGQLTSVRDDYNDFFRINFPEAFSEFSGALLTDKDFQDFSTAFSTDVNKRKRILETEKQLPTILKDPTKQELYRAVINEALRLGANPRLTGINFLSETKGGSVVPGNNPAGVKISDITKTAISQITDDAFKQEAMERIFSLQNTRENLDTATAADLKEMFSDSRRVFASDPPNHKDIINRKQEVTDDLNVVLQTARATGDFSKLREKLDSYSNNDNKFFWVKQHFMRYPTIEAGVKDQVRAQKGGIDTSVWSFDNTTKAIHRRMPNGDVVEY